MSEILPLPMSDPSPDLSPRSPKVSLEAPSDPEPDLPLIPAHPIFYLTDVVHVIISFVPVEDSNQDKQKENFSYLLGYALVCSAWRDIALRVLWGTRNAWKHIFTILGPMKTTTAGAKEYEGMPTDATIARWQYYSKFIREIVMLETHGLETSAWWILATLRQQFVLFPSLTALQFTIGSQAGSEQLAYQALSLVHPQLTALHVSIPRSPSVNFPQLLRMVADISPNLAFLRLNMPLPVGDETVICSTLEKMIDLRRVSLPTRWQTPAILRALGKLPQLRYLTFITKADLDTSEPRMNYNDLLKDHKPSEDPIFTTLQRLQIATPLTNFETLIQQVFQHSPLETLFVKVPHGSQTREPLLGRVSAQIAKFPKLTALQIAFVDRKITDQPFNLDALHALSRCDSLQVFTLYGVLHTIINEDSLLNLSRNWSHLTHLSFEFSLALSLSAPDSSLVSLKTLGQLAPFLPNLESLFLYFASKLDELDRIIPGSFPRLVSFNIGWSLMVPHPEPGHSARVLSRFLSILLPNPICEIKHLELKNLTPPPRMKPEDWLKLSDHREEMLRELKALLPLLRMIREEERREILRKTMEIMPLSAEDMRRSVAALDTSFAVPTGHSPSLANWKPRKFDNDPTILTPRLT